MAKGRGHALIAALAATVVAACGSSAAGRTAPAARHPAQPAPGSSAFVPGRFDTLPVLPLMQAVSPVIASGGVTTRSYQVRGYTPRRAVETYAQLLVGWNNVVRPHAERSSFRGTWQQDGYEVVVTAVPAPGLTEHDSAETLEMTLQLYGRGTPASTLAPRP